MIKYKTADSINELQSILALQQVNLPVNLSREQMQHEGFVTVTHSLEQLVKMNDIEKHIIALDSEIVVGYLLAMTEKSQADIPVLVPMFNAFNDTMFNNKRISEYHFIIVGQACIAAGYRGQGILQKMYEDFRSRYQSNFDFVITEIDTSNTRSLNAHKKIGFLEIATYLSPGNTEWSIVIWNWNWQG